MSSKTLMSWSSGKDSAWALYQLQQQPESKLTGLVCTVNQRYRRVAMHGVRLALLQKQAEHVGLPLTVIDLPFPCSNAQYEAIMGEFVEQAEQQGHQQMAFGDLFLQDVREYRERMLAPTALTPIFPLWQQATDALARQMVEQGLRAVVTCVDPKQAPAELAGRLYDRDFLDDLPEGVDPCGERGEFHTFVFAGPMFKRPINIEIGEIVERDGFVFADVRPG